jgi:AcrR family transcriptional regulator
LPVRAAERNFAPRKKAIHLQTLKAEIRKRILTQSRKLFLEKGFRETTTRDIAERSGVVLSSLYRYFSSKNDIFACLVQPAAKSLEDLLERHHNSDLNDISIIQSDNYTEVTLNEYLDAIQRNRISLKLLLLKAEGSSYAGFKEEYVNRATRMVLAWFRSMKAKYPGMNTQVSDFFIHLNNVWMFTLLEEILMHDLPEDETRSVLLDYIQFEYTGWKKMMKV